MGVTHADLVDAVIAFAETSKPEDEMFILSFNEKPYFGLPPSVPFTSDPERLRAALLKGAPSGMTALYDALALGLDHLRRGSRDRRALLVLSDGADNASRLRLDEVLQRVRASKASIYTIGIYDDMSSDRNPAVLRRIAQLGGGQAYFPSASDDLVRVWNGIAEEIHGQYTIGYTSSNSTHDGQFRNVRITVAGEGGLALQVRARDGYLASTQVAQP
jgi:Ca-activated chloride channel family protein